MDVLREFRDEPLPPSGVDVARAVRTGRRRRRARIGVVALGLVAVVAAGAATAPRWQPYLPGRTGSNQVGDGPVGSPPLTCPEAAPLPARSLASVEPGQAPDEFDLLRYWVDVDDVAGYQAEQTATSRFWQRLELKDPTRASTVEITLYASGVQPVFASAPSAAPEPVDPTTGTPTTPVRGAAAYWLPGRQGLVQFEVARLGWQWAPGAWAFVAAADTSSFDSAVNETPKTQAQIDQLRGVARQVAEKVRIGQGAPVTSPFTMPVPDCTRLVGTDLLRSTTTDDRPFTRFTLTFSTDEYDRYDTRTPLLSRSGYRTVSVASDSIAQPGDKPGSVVQTVDGHPARYGGDSLMIFDVDGFALEIGCPGGPDATLALYHRLHVVPGAHDNPAAWTDAPLQP